MSKSSQAQLDLDAQVYRMRLKIAQLYRKRNALAPISQLPPEILGRVLYFAFPDQLDTSKGSVPAFLRAIAPTHVSYEWRSVALGTPYLWTSFTVCCNANWGSHEKAVNSVWERCRGALVSLSLRQLGSDCPRGALFDAFAAKIYQDPARFRTLSICTSNGSQDVRAIFPPGRNLGFDALQSLTVRPGYGAEATVVPGDLEGLHTARAPCLRRIKLGELAPVVWRAPLVQSALGHLAELTAVHGPASGPYADLFSVLSAAPQLRTVKLSLNSPFDRKDREEVPDASVVLLTLRQIHLDAPDPNSLVNFLRKIRVDKRRVESVQLHHQREWADYNEGLLKRFWALVRHTFHHSGEGNASVLAPAAIEIQDACPWPGGLAGWPSVDAFRRNYAQAHCGYPNNGGFSNSLEASIWVSPPLLAGLDPVRPAGARIIQAALSFDRLTYLTLFNYEPWTSRALEPTHGGPGRVADFGRVLAFGCPALATLWCKRPYVTRSFLEGLLQLCGEGNMRKYGERVPFPALRHLWLGVESDSSGRRWENVAGPRTKRAVKRSSKSMLDFLGRHGSGSTSPTRSSTPEDVWHDQLDWFSAAALNIGQILEIRKEIIMKQSTRRTGQDGSSIESANRLESLNIYANQDPGDGHDLDSDSECHWTPLLLDDRVRLSLAQVSQVVTTRSRLPH